MQIRPRFPATADYAIAPFEAQPCHILEKIIWHKEQEVAQLQAQLPLTDLQTQVTKAPTVRNFLNGLLQSSSQPSLIAEVKKASPSKGILRADFDPVEIALAYAKGGAACLSVLSDRTFFAGSFDNLFAIRMQVSLPLLCKEFIINPYQIYLARAQGADAVLLIAAILSDLELQDYLELTHSLGMEALVEVHTLAECDRVLSLSGVRLLGINNRNLDDFSVNLQTTEQIISQRQEQLHSLGITTVSESGIQTKADLERLAHLGIAAVLVGESLIKQPNLEQAVKNLRGRTDN